MNGVQTGGQRLPEARFALVGRQGIALLMEDGQNDLLRHKVNEDVHLQQAEVGRPSASSHLEIVPSCILG